MKVVIVGAGLTGLAAAHQLNKNGHQVTILESSAKPGGLAAGFQADGWQWELEYHYHHLFQTDQAIAQLLQECGLRENLVFRSVKSSILRAGQQFVFDSPLAILFCPILDFFSKLRVGLTMAFLKFNPIWQPLEKITAHRFLRLTMGEKSYQDLWQTLFEGKFGRFHETVNAAWFWARVFVRTPKLGYYQGGFGQMSKDIADYLIKSGVEIQYNQKVTQVSLKRDRPIVKLAKGGSLSADRVLLAMPSPVLEKLIPDLPASYIKKLHQLKGLGAVTLVMELTQPFFTDQTYWLSINETNWPILAVVEHTQFQDKARYGRKHLVYVGKYLEATSDQYQLSDAQLLDLYHPFLEKLSPGYKRYLNRFFVFRTPFAQPVVGLNHSRLLPSVVTPLPSVYWASMQHIYPYDRGMNYAVALGVKVADDMI